MAKRDNPKAAEKATTTRKAAAPKELTPCECGCGGKATRRFLPGHDAKLKGQLIRQAIDGDANAEKRLDSFGWTHFLAASKAKAERLAERKSGAEARKAEAASKKAEREKAKAERAKEVADRKIEREAAKAEREKAKAAAAEAKAKEAKANGAAKAAGSSKKEAAAK